MAVTVPQQAKRVRYVYIPADVHEELQERELEVDPGREVESLLDELKGHFRRAGGTKTAAQREAHRQHLLSQVGAEAAAKVNEDMLAAALDMQMVETLPLLVNNPSSGYLAVNLYCDDQAQVKELPPNPRASQIADCCGRPTQVRGDAFLSRLFDNDDAFVRLDLSLGEVSSAAPWVAAAAAQAARRMAEGDRAADFVAKMQRQQQQQGQQTGTAATTTIRELGPAEAEKEAGNAAVRAGDWAAAVARYGAALDLDPGLTAAANNRALALLRLGRHEEAERDCCQVLATEPSNVKALLRRAAARSGLGRGAEAADDLRAVLALEPHNKEAAAELAKMAPPPPPPPLPAAEAAAPGAAEAAEAGPTAAEAPGAAEAAEDRPAPATEAAAPMEAESAQEAAVAAVAAAAMDAEAAAAAAAAAPPAGLRPEGGR